MRGKKGDIENFLIVLFVLLAIGGLLAGNAASKQTIVNIGDRHALMLKAYVEAEKVREYFDSAARLAAISTAKELGATGDNCFVVAGLDEKFKSKIETFFNYDLSSDPQLTATLPYVAWSITAGPSKVAIIGAASDKIIVKGEDFEYGAGLYVSQVVSCADVASVAQAAA